MTIYPSINDEDFYLHCNCVDYFEWKCHGICFRSVDNPFNVTPVNYPAWTKCPCGYGEFILTEPCDYCKQREVENHANHNTITD